MPDRFGRQGEPGRAGRPPQGRSPQGTGGSRPYGQAGWHNTDRRHNPDFYFENGVVKESLLTTEAYNWADRFKSAQPKLTSAQLRRFYHEVKAIEARMKAEGFEANAPLLRLLEAKVAYACPRGGGSRDKKVPDIFAEFMWQHLAQVRDAREFDAFTKVFEAVVGFFYHLEGR